MKRIFYILLFSCYCATLWAQQFPIQKPNDSSSIWQLAKYDAQSTVQGVGHAFTRPLHWQKDDIRKFTTFMIGTFALSLADEPFNDFVLEHRDSYPGVAREIGWYFGSPQNYFMVNAGLYSVGLFTKNETIRKTSVLIISSSITSGLIQTITKNAVGRARPSSGLDYDEFDPFSKEAAYHSFPSGHTILSVTMAHAIAKQFENTWVKVGIYSLGSLAPLSRLVDGAHWLTDIAFGAALSIFVVDSIDKFLFQKGKYDYHLKPKKVSWNIKISSNQIGLVGTF